MKKYILSIDAGTTGITVILLNKFGDVINKEYSEFTQIYPKPSWVEHCPNEIWELTLLLIKHTLKKYNSSEIDSIGITNQRETTVLWNKNSGKPIYNAIVWQCKRTSEICTQLKNEGLSTVFESKTGLLIDSYFSGTKINWILNHVENAQRLAENGDILFGTIDTWLLWNLTNSKIHATDYTNASRTLIYNIDDKCWDDKLLSILNIPKQILPQVFSSSSIYGYTDKKLFDEEIPIAGIAGDQQSALFGQNGFTPNSIKNTYGTGCFLLVNTGQKRINSTTGMLNTLACDEYGNPVYALEGSVFIGGAVMQWIRDELGFIKNASESEDVAMSIENTGGVYMVPAFTGLGSPYWDMDARGLICGITRGTNKSHLVRAGLESIAYQVKDLIDGIQSNLAEPLTELKVDGGATQNDFLMQFQSDILDIKINKPVNIETTATGAGYLAGLATGFWKSSSDLISARKVDKVYHPNIANKKRELLISGWRKAINKTLK
ncbi:MAG: glycerol kinase GlpK [Candidatus Marinimicrobia bacterium]|nr:glycerol kinase GlpK [Candidatus Neomarinimicrobiota bacterium]